MTTDLPIGMMGQPEHLIAKFRRLVASGESPRIAEICALRTAPGGKTDKAHFKGLNLAHLAKTIGPSYVEKITAQARAAGISVGENSFYNGSLADKRGGGDPGAWIRTGEGRAKLKETALSRGMATADGDEVQFGQSEQRVEFANKWLEGYDKRKAEKKAVKAEIESIREKKGIKPKILTGKAEA